MILQISLGLQGLRQVSMNLGHLSQPCTEDSKRYQFHPEARGFFPEHLVCLLEALEYVFNISLFHDYLATGSPGPRVGWELPDGAQAD